MVILPVVGRSAFASYLICRLVTLPGYRGVRWSDAYVNGSWKLGCEREVGIVEGNDELAFFVERVLEIDCCGLGAGRTLNRTLQR